VYAFGNTFSALPLRLPIYKHVVASGMPDLLPHAGSAEITFQGPLNFSSSSSGWSRTDQQASRPLGMISLLLAGPPPPTALNACLGASSCGCEGIYSVLLGTD
jgi:hypothetical protein